VTADLRVRIAKALFMSHLSDHAARTAPEIMTLCDEAADVVMALLAAHPVQGEGALSWAAVHADCDTCSRYAALVKAGVISSAPNHVPTPVQVATAEELDALPVGSVVACWYTDGSGPNVYARRDDSWRPGWEATGDGEGPYSSSSIMSGPDPRPLTVLYRPEVAS